MLSCKRISSSVLVLVCVVFLFSCGSDPKPNPVPSISSINPTSAVAGGAAFTLTVTGSNFVSGSTVLWNSSARPTTAGSATQLTASISASDIATAGTVTVTVQTPAPGGGTSAGQTFTIQAPNPAPTVSKIWPTSAVAGDAAFTLTITGTGFINSSTVQWNGTNRTTTYVSPTQLTAAITAADVATAGTATVTVVTPTPGGGTSAAQTFTIQAPNPAPTLSDISPINATAGDSAFILTVNGTGFINSSTVQWNGSARTTTYVSATQLTAAITAADVATAGTATVTVVTPTPGGGTSAGKVFTIDPGNPNPVPDITSLSPSGTTAGHAAFTLTVNGTNFIQSSVVRWEGSDRTTTYISETQLGAAITAADVASTGFKTVTVFNPAPGGGTSAGVTFTVNAAGVVPVPEYLQPPTAISGTDGFVMNIQGSRFIDGCTAMIGGSPRATTFLNYYNIKVFITADDIKAAGSFDVTVKNPDGSTSAALPLSVVDPVVPGVFDRITSVDGYEPTSDVSSPIITPDGRYVVFGSYSSNLVPGDTNGFTDIYRRDTCIGAPAGCVRSLEIVSLTNDGGQINASAYTLENTAITPDGRYVVFTTIADNVVPNDTNGVIDVFVRDTCTNAPPGCTPSTQIASVATDGTLSNDHSGHVAISDNGRYVTFENYGTTFGYMGDAVWVRDTCNGVTSGCTPTTNIVSFNAYDGVTPGSGGRPSISADGRYIAWDDSFSTGRGVFVTDTCAGADAPCTPHAFQIDLDGIGDPMHGYGAAISANGRYLSFTRYVSSMGKVYAADTCIGVSGCTPSIALISDPTDGSTPAGGTFDSSVISPDGRYIGFKSFDKNLVPNDTNNVGDLFIYDTCFTTTAACTPTTLLATRGYDGTQLNQSPYIGSNPLTSGAKILVFSTRSQNMVPWDSNSYDDTFLVRTGL